MRARFLPPAIFVFIAFLVTGCTVSVDGGTTPPDPDHTVAAEALGSGDAPQAYDFVIDGGDSLLFEVTLSSAARDNEAVFFELGTDQGLEMILYNASGAALASADNGDVFLSGTSAVGTSAMGASGATAGPEGLAPQVTTVENCQGVCIIRDADRSTFYLRVNNQQSGTRSLDLYVYTKSYRDEYEPQNDAQDGAVSLARGQDDSGAIESLGDVDYWEFTESGSLFFYDLADRPAELDLVILIYDTAGNPSGPYEPNSSSSIRVFAGETAVVYERGDDAAAVSGSSTYFLELQ